MSRLSGPAAAIRDAIRRSSITWIEAPAGWGKTTAAREALAGHDVVWCGLERAPDEPGALAFSLLRALGRETSLLGPLLRSAEVTSPPHAVGAWLASALPSGKLVVVFDDLHCVARDALSLSVLASLIALGLSEREFVIITRPDPGIDPCAVLQQSARYACGAYLTPETLRE